MHMASPHFFRYALQMAFTKSGPNMTRIVTITFALLIALSSLSACGRRGPLEAPSAAANPPAGAPASEPVEEKPFVLDKLIQ
jgi:predicted small lipoprotein YifL